MISAKVHNRHLWVISDFLLLLGGKKEMTHAFWWKKGAFGDLCVNHASAKAELRLACWVCELRTPASERAGLSRRASKNEYLLFVCFLTAIQAAYGSSYQNQSYS